MYKRYRDRKKLANGPQDSKLGAGHSKDSPANGLLGVKVFKKNKKNKRNGFNPERIKALGLCCVISL